jgi:alpha-glucosidase
LEVSFWTLQIEDSCP